MTNLRAVPPTPKPAADEPRKLLVHPAVWRSLEAWLHDMRIKVAPFPVAGEATPTYCMTLMDGEWGGDGSDAA